MTVETVAWRDRVGEFWRYFAPVLVILAIGVLAIWYPLMALYAAITVLIVTPCVLVHEWGHYLAARRFRMQVSEFSIGFGHRLVSRERDGVRWSLKVVPFGGSVEIAGMTVEQAAEEQVDPTRSFIDATPLRRLVTIGAGVGMNLLAAWVALTVVSIALAPGHHGWTTYLLAPINGLVVLGRLLAMAYQALVELITNFAQSDLGSILSMPYMLSQGVADAQGSGMPLWMFAALVFALVNLSLAVFNALPLFPLDGYHVMVALIDGVRRRRSHRSGQPFQPLTTRQLGWFTTASALAFGILVALILVKDIVRLFG